MRFSGSSWFISKWSHREAVAGRDRGRPPVRAFGASLLKCCLASRSQFQIKTHETSKRLATRIRDLYAKHRDRDSDVFTDTIRVDDETLRVIVSHLEAINLSATDQDVKGVAFEQFMDSFFKGDFGQ